MLSIIKLYQSNNEELENTLNLLLSHRKLSVSKRILTAEPSQGDQ